MLKQKVRQCDGNVFAAREAQQNNRLVPPPAARKRGPGDYRFS